MNNRIGFDSISSHDTRGFGFNFKQGVVTALNSACFIESIAYDDESGILTSAELMLRQQRNQLK